MNAHPQGVSTRDRLLLKYLRQFPLDTFKSKVSRSVDINALDRHQLHTNRNGVTLALDLNEHSNRNIFLYDFYERNTFRNLVRLIEQNWVCVDAGANIGFYTLNVASLVPSGRVHSFEPNPDVFQQLRGNVGRNSFSNITLNQVGLSDHARTTTLYVPQSHHGAGSLHEGAGVGEQAVEVDLQTLDAYCELQNIDSVDLIKVDIEGHEGFFLDGATETIDRSPRLVLVMEMARVHHDRAGYGGDDLFHSVCARGFRAYLPRSFPKKLEAVTKLPVGYKDNIIFLKGY